MVPDRSNTAPTHHVYSIVQREGVPDLWLHIGFGFTRADGAVDVRLQALPIDGKAVLREIPTYEITEPMPDLPRF
jgi:hypothetical protein